MCVTSIHRVVTNLYHGRATLHGQCKEVQRGTATRFAGFALEFLFVASFRCIILDCIKLLRLRDVRMVVACTVIAIGARFR